MKLKSFLYFLAAPTLCFQLEYARSPSIRPWFIVKRLAELVCLVVVQVFVLLQFIYPTLLKAPEVLNASEFSLLRVVPFVCSSAVQVGPSVLSLLDHRLPLLLPRRLQHHRGTPPIRRPRVLQGLVELSQSGRVLAHVEHARASVLPPPRLPAHVIRRRLTRDTASTPSTPSSSSSRPSLTST